MNVILSFQGSERIAPWSPERMGRRGVRLSVVGKEEQLDFSSASSCFCTQGLVTNIIHGWNIGTLPWRVQIFKQRSRRRVRIFERQGVEIVKQRGVRILKQWEVEGANRRVQILKRKGVQMFEQPGVQIFEQLGCKRLNGKGCKYPDGRRLQIFKQSGGRVQILKSGGANF